MGRTVAHPLDSARLKVERTWEHLEQFNAESRSFFQTQPYAFTAGPSKGDPEYGAIYVHTRRQIPEHVSLVFGDAVHTLRSALDHLAYQLAFRLGTGPTRRTQWPIFDDPALFESYGSRHLEGILEPHRSRIVDMQPFKDPNGLRWLSLLHELDIADKHHNIGQLIAAPTHAEITTPQGVIKVRNPEGPVYVKDGAEIMRFRMPDDPATAEVRMDTKFDYRIFVGDEKHAFAADAILVWSYAVLEILNAFAPEFG
jgi:hypothetical protein